VIARAERKRAAQNSAASVLLTPVSRVVASALKTRIATNTKLIVAFRMRGNSRRNIGYILRES
jgi:hypothetical protein